MCLAVPARLIKCNNSEAVAEMHGNCVNVSTLLVPEVQEGDWVLVHAGFAIQRLSEKDVAEAWAVLEDVKRAGERETAKDRHVGDPSLRSG